MVPIPSGTPIPTPTAVGKLAECFWLWTGTEGLVNVSAGEAAVTVVAEDAVMVAAVEPGPAEKVVVTVLPKVVVGADDKDVTGGNPSILPLG